MAQRTNKEAAYLLCNGFTLIELLIVVAIIAILAAIAVPNFMEAQTRTKVSRAKSDMRIIDGALTAYNIDHNAFPYPFESTSFVREWVRRVTELTTPVAYLASVELNDPFSPWYYAYRLPDGSLEPRPANVPPAPAGYRASYLYVNYAGRFGNSMVGYGPPGLNVYPFVGFCLTSSGPDKMYEALESAVAMQGPYGEYAYQCLPLYDPTNGTVSRGDIGRWVGKPGHP